MEDSPREPELIMSQPAEKQAPPDVEPVSESRRINSIDVLRGFALLGILVINILFFALPQSALLNPLSVGGFIGLNKIAWFIGYILFFQKYMAVFSMLFGAGVILFTIRGEETGKRVTGVFYRRVLWLLVFGIIHGYFLWSGDILYTYAICGMVIYLFRNFKARNLIVIGLLLFTVGMFIQMGGGSLMNYMRSNAMEAQALIDKGEKPNAFQQNMLDSWKQNESQFNPGAEKIQEQIDTYRSGYWTIFKDRAGETVMMQTVMLLMYGWRVIGLMLIGMGLMKLRFFTAELPLRLYLITAAVAFIIGYTLVFIGNDMLIDTSFDIILKFKGIANYSYIGGLLIAIGNASLIMIICKLELFDWLRKSLAAVGRMAFSNYLFHTVVFTTIFYGYGLGLYGRFERYQLFYFVIGMWIFQLIVSPIWLKYFKYGPLEWLWRSLTYKKMQPMRRRPAPLMEPVG